MLQPLTTEMSRMMLDELRTSARHLPDSMDWFWNRSRTPVMLDAAQRLQGLAAYWAEAKVSFAYWDQVPDLDWDAAFRQYVPLVMGAEEPRHYYQLLREFSSLLRDGHTHVIPPLWVAAAEGAPPLRLYPVEGWAVVIEGDLLPPGTRVLSVDGQDADLLMQERLAVEPASTEHDRLQRVVSSLLEGPLGSVVKVTAELPSGEIVQVDLPREERRLLPLLERVDLGGSVVLVRINTWETHKVVELFNEQFPDFNGVEALILDLRRNRGGDSHNGNQVLSRLVDHPVEPTASQVPMYAGALRGWNLPRPVLTFTDQAIRPDQERPRYQGPVAVLTSSATYSAAENFCVAFRQSGRGPIVGEPTGGSTGQPVLFELPGGGVGVICAKRTTYADGGQIVGRGVMPDVHVAPTRSSLAAARDLVLARAIAELAR